MIKKNFNFAIQVWNLNSILQVEWIKLNYCSYLVSGQIRMLTQFSLHSHFVMRANIFLQLPYLGFKCEKNTKRLNQTKKCETENWSVLN